MDFHGFTRKELQSLCKLNKIPANMTNVAMADALSSLHHVEGLEDIMQQRSVESVEGGSPDIPRTATRTSTRARKPPVNVLKSGGVVLNMEVAKTPAVACRKRGVGVGSSCKKVEVPSVQRVYSTRRSVRLVEKQFSELCLGDSVRRRKPIKIDDQLSSEVISSDIKGLGDDIKQNVTDEEVVNSKESVNTEVKKAISGAGVMDNTVAEIETNGMAGVTAIEEVKKSMPEDCAEDVDGGMISTDAEQETIGMADFDSVEEVDRAISEDCAEEVVGGMVSTDGEKETIAVIDVAAIEEVKTSMSGDVVNAMVNTDAEKETIVVTDVAANEEAIRFISEDCPKDAVDAMVNTVTGNSDDANEVNEPTEVAASVEQSICKDYVVEAVEVDGAMENGVNKSAVIIDTAANKEVKKAVTEDCAEGFIGAGVTVTACMKEEAETTTKACFEEAVDGLDNTDDAGMETNVGKTAQCHSENHLLALQLTADYDKEVADNVIVEEIVAPQEPKTATEGSLSAKIIADPILGVTPLKGQLPIMRNVINKENISISLKNEESYETAKTLTPLQKQSMRQLLKKFKKLKTDNQEEDGNSKKHIEKQHNAVTPRKALQKIPDNTQKE